MVSQVFQFHKTAFLLNFKYFIECAWMTIKQNASNRASRILQIKIFIK